jgi:hypothetical protein
VYSALPASSDITYMSKFETPLWPSTSLKRYNHCTLAIFIALPCTPPLQDDHLKQYKLQVTRDSRPLISTALPCSTLYRAGCPKNYPILQGEQGTAPFYTLFCTFCDSKSCMPWRWFFRWNNHLVNGDHLPGVIGEEVLVVVPCMKELSSSTVCDY